MDDLFDPIPPPTTYISIRNPQLLAPDAAAYNRGGMTRPPGDPIGRGWLPTSRRGLDIKANNLCARLDAAMTVGVKSSRLVADLGLRDSRSLRLLVAYCRVWGGVHQIVGIPGSRYFWADHRPELYKLAIDDCTRRGRCYLFIASLHRRQGSAMAAAQMMFDWFDAAAGKKHNDDLAALAAAEGVGVGDVFSAFVDLLKQSEGGRQTLARMGEKHQDVLLPASARDRMLAACRQFESTLLALTG